jgi:hypothetical protein
VDAELNDGVVPPSESKPDKVGYKNPPKHSQFKKGQVNNPKGRPPKSRNLWAIYDEERDAIVTARGAGGRLIKMTKLQAAMKQLWAKAATGDMKAIENVIRYEQLRERPGDDTPRETPLTAAEKAKLADFVQQLAMDHAAEAGDIKSGEPSDRAAAADEAAEGEGGDGK